MTTRSARSLLILLVLLLVAAPAAARDADKVQRLSVPLTDPSRPVTLHASLFSGDLQVEAHQGNQILIELVPGDEPESPERAGGMRVIPNRSLGLTVEEQDNVVSINSDFTGKTNRVVVKVPRRTSVSASTVQSGDIVVSGIEGELELSSTSGSITATDVAGSVVAHTTNGTVKVSFTSVQAGKSMSFVTFNGDVDVTFPGDLKADLRLSAGPGKIYTDFEFDLVPTESQMKSERSGKKFRVQLDQDVRARIEGGGAEMHFKTWNGDIFIRKRGR
jgi:putative adhesin